MEKYTDESLPDAEHYVLKKQEPLILRKGTAKNMKYENLHELIRHSSSTRKYFLSLPVEMQLTMHEQNEYIHTAEELRDHVIAARDYARHVELGNRFWF